MIDGMRIYEDPEFDLHQYIIETESKLFSSNIQDNFFYPSKNNKSLTLM